MKLTIAIWGMLALAAALIVAIIGGCWIADECGQVAPRVYVTSGAFGICAIGGLMLSPLGNRPPEGDAVEDVVILCLMIQLVAVGAAVHQIWNPYDDPLRDFVPFGTYMAVIGISSLTTYNARNHYRAGRETPGSSVLVGFVAIFWIVALSAGFEIAPAAAWATLAPVAALILAAAHFLAAASFLQLTLSALPPVWALATSAISLTAPLATLAVPSTE